MCIRDSVISALNDADPQAATAAGLAGGDGAGDLTPGLRVDRVSEGLTPFALLQGASGDEPLRNIRPPAATTDAVATDAPAPVEPPANNAPATGALFAGCRRRHGRDSDQHTVDGCRIGQRHGP